MSTIVDIPAPPKPKIKLGIGIPLYGGMGFAGFFVSLINTMNLLKQQGVDSYPIFILGESLITRARNNIVAKFLNDPESTHLMFIDGDITWDPIEVVKLLNHNKELVGGIYPLKTYKWENLKNIEEYKTRNKSELNKNVPEHEFIRQNLMKYNLNFKYANFQIQNNLVEVKHIATGFMMIKRSLLEKLIMAHYRLKFFDDMGCLSKDEDRFAYTLFDCEISEGHYLSEDWRFCKLVSDMNIPIYADVSINLTHHGITGFAGRFLSSLNIVQNPAPVTNANTEVQKTVDSSQPQSQQSQPSQPSPQQPQPQSQSSPPQQQSPQQPQQSLPKSSLSTVNAFSKPELPPNIITEEIHTPNGIVTVINSRNSSNIAEPNLDWVQDLEQKLYSMKAKISTIESGEHDETECS